MKKDINKIEHLMEIAGKLNRMGWKLEITSDELIVEKRDSMLCSMLFLSEIETFNEHAPFDVYLDEFFYEMDQEKEVRKLRKIYTWNEILDMLEVEYNELIAVKEIIHKWYLGE